MNASETVQLAPSGLVLYADVLVLGGGPAGTWAALTAARTGARVVLADKGYCGSSGATAPSGTGVWYIPPDPQLRYEAKMSHHLFLGLRPEKGGSRIDRACKRGTLHQLRIMREGMPDLRLRR